MSIDEEEKFLSSRKEIEELVKKTQDWANEIYKDKVTVTVKPRYFLRPRIIISVDSEEHYYSMVDLDTSYILLQLEKEDANFFSALKYLFFDIIDPQKLLKDKLSKVDEAQKILQRYEDIFLNY